MKNTGLKIKSEGLQNVWAQIWPCIFLQNRVRIAFDNKINTASRKRWMSIYFISDFLNLSGAKLIKTYSFISVQLA